MDWVLVSIYGIYLWFIVKIYIIIKLKEINKLYYVYHTFDCHQAIERILKSKNISFDLDYQNDLLKIMRNNKYERKINVLDANFFEKRFYMF